MAKVKLWKEIELVQKRMTTSFYFSIRFIQDGEAMTGE